LRILLDRDAPSSNTVLVGADIGVFRTTDGGGHWQSFNLGTAAAPDIPAVPVTDLQQNNNGTMFAATFGRGVFRESTLRGEAAEPAETRGDS
jgi:hypothetical protein